MTPAPPPGGGAGSCGGDLNDKSPDLLVVDCCVADCVEPRWFLILFSSRSFLGFVVASQALVSALASVVRRWELLALIGALPITTL